MKPSKPVAAQSHIRTSFDIELVTSRGFTQRWRFQDIDDVRAVRDELSRLVDGLSQVTPPPG